MPDEDSAASRSPRQWNVHREAEYSRGYKKASGNRADVREVCTTKAVRAPRSTKIRRNFNISRRRERAECNPLDKRLPPPWCPLTNRGHRFRAELRRQGRTVSTVGRETSIADLERNVSLCTRERRIGESRQRGEEGENEKLAGWDPRSFAALCRQNKLLGLVAQDVVFAIIAGRESTRTRETRATGHCRLSFIRVVAADKCRGDSSLDVPADFLARWRDGERVRGGNGRVSATREPFVSRVGIMVPDFEPCARSWRAINMGRRIADDDDGYVPRFRLRACYYFRLAATRKSTVSTREKNRTFI